MRTAIIISALVLGLSGCMSRPEPKVGGGEAEAKQPKVKQELTVIPADQMHYYKPQEAPPPPPPPPKTGMTTGDVLTPEEVHAYPIARYRDPSNPNIMHERHVVYRRDKARWKLDAQPEEQLIVGPTTNQAPNSQPMQNQEVDSFLLEQKRINESNRRMMEALYTAVSSIQEELIKQGEQESARAQAQAEAQRPTPAPAPAPAAQSPDPEKTQPEAPAEKGE